MLAPIVIFAFNRPQALKKCIDSLRLNPEAASSDLFVFVDGNRTDCKDEEKLVEDVRRVASGIGGFNSVRTFFSSDNKGLGPSVIAGVTEVINRYGAAIIVEDDLIVSANFLSFMNQGLGLYKDEKDVFSICGYTNSVRKPKDYIFDAYFCSRSSSWGWATWNDRWNSCDWQLSDWKSVERNAWRFNIWGGSDCFKMLMDWKEGRNKSWAIRFCYNQFVQRAVSLFPMVSKVKNEGFDGSGTNCGKWSRFKSDFDLSGFKEFHFPDRVYVVPGLRRQSIRYHSLLKRAYSRIMYLIYR